MAANHYRRNRLAHSAGGVTIDDKNKEREYMAEGQRLWRGVPGLAAQQEGRDQHEALRRERRLGVRQPQRVVT
jgi:hypothetical protein